MRGVWLSLVLTCCSLTPARAGIFADLARVVGCKIQDVADFVQASRAMPPEARATERLGRALTTDEVRLARAVAVAGPTTPLQWERWLRTKADGSSLSNFLELELRFLQLVANQAGQLDALPWVADCSASARSQWRALQRRGWRIQRSEPGASPAPPRRSDIDVQNKTITLGEPLGELPGALRLEEAIEIATIRTGLPNRVRFPSGLDRQFRERNTLFVIAREVRVRMLSRLEEIAGPRPPAAWQPLFERDHHSNNPALADEVLMIRVSARIAEELGVPAESQARMAGYRVQDFTGTPESAPAALTVAASSYRVPSDAARLIAMIPDVLLNPPNFFEVQAMQQPRSGQQGRWVILPEDAAPLIAFVSNPDLFQRPRDVTQIMAERADRATDAVLQQYHPTYAQLLNRALRNLVGLSDIPHDSPLYDAAIHIAAHFPPDGDVELANRLSHFFDHRFLEFASAFRSSNSPVFLEWLRVRENREGLLRALHNSHRTEFPGAAIDGLWDVVESAYSLLWDRFRSHRDDTLYYASIRGGYIYWPDPACDPTFPPVYELLQSSLEYFRGNAERMQRLNERLARVELLMAWEASLWRNAHR